MTQRLGRYQILNPLAAGGMGEIFLAEHTGLSGFAKRVALKQISPEYANNPSYVELFLNEARVGSFLNHPNIVHIFDVGHENGALWLVMEYVDGIDLKRLNRRASLAGQPIAPTTLAAVMVEVLSALEEAHAGGPFRREPIIHRDMSPENILIARSGAVKVLDFGLAKWAPGRSKVPSMEGNLIFGKIRYMPPEQLKGEPIDVRADLFALGVVMYEALRGVLPFGSENANAVLARIMRGRPPTATAQLVEPDPLMDALIYRAMEPNPERRYQSAPEMRAALVDYLDRRKVSLPLESLRRLLQPEGPLAFSGPSKDGANDNGPLAERTLPQIGLNVALRCGKCGGNFAALFLDGLIVDRCTSCRGVWLDHGEIMRIMRAASVAVRTSDRVERAPLDAIHGSCPSCKVGLRRFDVPGQPATLEACPHCYGVWFDAGELRLLEQSDVVSWLRTTLESLKLLEAV